MAKSEIRKEFEAFLKKVEVQRDLFLKKIGEVDTRAAAEDASLYESFMPVVDEYLEDLAFFSNSLYSVIESMNEKIVGMYDSIESQMGSIPDEDFIEPEGEPLPDLSPEEEKDVFNPSDDTVDPSIEVENEYPESFQDEDDSDEVK